MKKNFLGNILTVAGGTAFAQMLMLVAAPFLTRIYGPEFFGIWGVFNATAMVLASILSLTYPTAIMLPKDDHEAVKLVQISFTVTILFSLLLSTVSILFTQQIASLLNIKSDYQLVYFLVPYAFFYALGMIFQQWIIRKSLFKKVATSNMSQSIVIAASQIGLGLVMPSPLILVLSNLLGKITFSVSLLRASFLNGLSLKSGLQFSIQDLKTISLKYSNFPKFRAPQVFVDSISQSIPITLLSVFFSPVIAGFYTLARTVLAVPGQLVGNAVADVYYPRISEMKNEGSKIFPSVFKATLLLLLVTAPFFLIILFLAPQIFSIAFGQDWRVAGSFSQWLSIWIWFMIANRPALQAINVLNKQRTHLALTLVGTVVRLSSIVVCFYLGFSAVTTVAVFSITAAFFNILIIFLVLRICYKNDNSAGKFT